MALAAYKIETWCLIASTVGFSTELSGLYTCTAVARLTLALAKLSCQKWHALFGILFYLSIIFPPPRNCPKPLIFGALSNILNYITFVLFLAFNLKCWLRCLKNVGYIVVLSRYYILLPVKELHFNSLVLHCIFLNVKCIICSERACELKMCLLLSKYKKYTGWPKKFGTIFSVRLNFTKY